MPSPDTSKTPPRHTPDPPQTHPSHASKTRSQAHAQTCPTPAPAPAPPAPFGRGAGDLNAFEEQLATHQQRFIRHGSYLLVERSKLIVYRNFFRRVALLHPDKSTKLDIKRFQACLKATNTEMEVDEIECILANLIYCGYIKGYISHAHGKLVVSKGAPFPPLRELGLTSAV
mmetsp:Transcript_5215/g.16714  ORF Transcript_5215/g.16714 Transcript_5215/m.16714 type:complete len:172 (-) Transcript_5215:182-697(-)